MRRLFVIASAMLAIGCGGASPVSPSPAAAPQSLEIWGWVRDTSTWPCVRCTVEMIDGPRAGTSSLTDSLGYFSFFVPAAFTPVTLRVVQDGYHPATHVVDAVTPTQLGLRATAAIELEALVPSRNLVGTYTLTVNTDRTCTELPEVARQRVYLVTWSQASTRPTLYRATTRGGSFLSFRLFAGVAGDFVGLDTDSDISADGIVEELTASTSLQIWGWGGAKAAGRSITVPMFGHVSYCPMAMHKGPNGFWRCPVTPVECESDTHELTLAPT